MTTEQINNGLIQIMREKIPAGTNLPVYLWTFFASARKLSTAG